MKRWDTATTLQRTVPIFFSSLNVFFRVLRWKKKLLVFPKHLLVSFLGNIAGGAPWCTELYHISQFIHLEVTNTLDTTTRFGRYSRQHDATTDLTWYSSALQPRWSTLLDYMGSDYFSIGIILHRRLRLVPKKFVNITNRNTFRTSLPSNSDSIDFYRNIKSAFFKATTTLHTRIGSPPPDPHFLNLWALRLLAQQPCRIRGKLPSHKLNKISPQLKLGNSRIESVGNNSTNNFFLQWEDQTRKHIETSSQHDEQRNVLRDRGKCHTSYEHLIQESSTLSESFLNRLLPYLAQVW